MPAPLTLPPGYADRPLALADSRAVFEVMAAQERHDLGEVSIEEADLLGDWQRPSFDLAASSVGVVDPGGTVVAYAEVTGGDRGDAAVHPRHRGLGIGTALAGWMQQRAREAGAAVVGMPVPEGSPGDRLLAALGYHVRWTSWVLELPAGASVPDRALPPGFVVGPADSPAHEHAAYVVQEDAFLEWSVRERETFEDWRAGVALRPGFEPWHLRVVLDSDGDVVAMAHAMVAGEHGEIAYVGHLATRADHRGRGLAQALLVDTFREARTRGTTRAMLDTDSRTGALGLYQRVGMRVTATWLNRAVAL